MTAGATWRSLFPATVASVGGARRAAVEELAKQGIGEDLRERVALVVSELSANAAQASTSEEFELSITVEHEPDRVRCTVINEAAAGDLPPRDAWRLDDLLARRGRGLGLVDAIAEDVDVRTSGPDLIIEVSIA